MGAARRALHAAQSGIRLLAGAWLTAVLTAALLALCAGIGAAEPVPVGWIVAAAAVAAVPLALAILLLYALFRHRCQAHCRPWQFLLAYAVSLVLLRVSGGIYTDGGAGGALTLLLAIVAAHWLLLFLACLTVLHSVLKHVNPRGQPPV